MNGQKDGASAFRRSQVSCGPRKARGKNVRIVLLPAESGAGGTTLARLTAFTAAKAGFPAMVAGEQVLRDRLADQAQAGIPHHCRDAPAAQDDRQPAPVPPSTVPSS